MFGITIISTKKLRRMRSLDESFRGIIQERDKKIGELEFKVNSLTEINTKLTRKRNEKGQFIKA